MNSKTETFKVDASEVLLINPYDNPPDVLWRISDGEKFEINENGTYSMENCMMVPKYEWSYKCLLNSKGFTAWHGYCDKWKK